MGSTFLSLMKWPHTRINHFCNNIWLQLDMWYRRRCWLNKCGRTEARRYLNTICARWAKNRGLQKLVCWVHYSKTGNCNVIKLNKRALNVVPKKVKLGDFKHRELSFKDAINEDLKYIVQILVSDCLWYVLLFKVALSATDDK